jgi:3-oxoacyl-[acyl-carrier protein] reductase
MGQRPAVVVTGVSKRAGIGAAVVRKLIASGWDVAMTGWPPYDETVPWGRVQGATEELLALAVASGARAVAIEADLGDPDAPRSVFESAEESLGPITALVVVHTHDPGGGLFDVSAAEFDRHMAINARATMLLIAEFARQFDGPTGRGRIVTFTSGLPLKGSIAYAASKGAIEWITVSAAAELAERGITVNAVNPGPNDTGWMSDDIRRKVEQESPLGRIGRPQDTAELVDFLCSEHSGWITGQIHASDGGWSKLR